MIEVTNLSKNFRRHEKEPGLKGSVRALFKRQWVEKKALDRVSLSIKEGEIVGLVGANGAGKTTLVKCLSGIVYPTSGDAKVLGHTPWERKNSFRQQIALIMGQKAQLWWDLPAADCFILLREIYQLPRSQFQENLDYLVQTLGVEELLTTQIRRLSLGERMKMELIASLLHEPKVVFLDEPTIGLDLTAQRAIRQFILDYREKHCPAMILTSHYMEDIERLCERLIILHQGRLVYDGTLQQVIQRYAHHKIITARLKQAMPLDLPHLTILEDGSRGLLQIKATRDDVPELVSHLLKTYSIIDLKIEEEDIGTIIESILQAGKVHDA